MDTQVSPRGTGTFVVIALVVVALWVGCWVGANYLIEDAETRGQFGDMFGAVNALFSGLAFAGIIFTILLQRDELRLQREELKLTRTELRGQREQMEMQNATMRFRNFEDTFFQLLRMHNDIVSGMDLRAKETGVVMFQGKDCFKHFYSTFKKRWEKKIPAEFDADEKARISKTYIMFYSQSESDLGHYFRSLYNLIKFVDASAASNKRLYTNLVRAQLSTFEVALLFYNSISPLGNDKFKPLIEKYGLLKMTPYSQLIDRAQHEPLYGKSAFGRDA